MGASRRGGSDEEDLSHEESARFSEELIVGILKEHEAGRKMAELVRDASVAVDVRIVPRTEKPSGCGEPPVPVTSRAVVNALFRLTGKRYRTLPLLSP